MDILNNFCFEKSVFKVENDESEVYSVDDLENDFTYHYADQNISDPVTSDTIEAPSNPENIYFDLASDDTKNENSAVDDLSNSVVNELDDDVIIEMEYFNPTKEVKSNKNPICIDLDQSSSVTETQKIPSVKSGPSKSADVSSDIKILDVRSLSEQDNNWAQNDEIYLVDKNDCEIEFIRTNNSNEPLQTHRAGKPWTCGICFLEFIDISQMLEHMRTHKGDKLFECSTCYERFPSKKDLTDHMLLHINEPHTCHICSLTFTKKFYYNNHMRTHNTVTQPYRCDVCSIRFTERRHLTSHLRTHNDDKPFSCNVCNLKFKWRYLLARHRRIHPE